MWHLVSPGSTTSLDLWLQKSACRKVLIIEICLWTLKVAMTDTWMQRLSTVFIQLLILIRTSLIELH